MRNIRAKYDAAQTNEGNRRHWANADGLSAGAANSPSVRRILRHRGRYEMANNGYLKGIALSLANDTIGAGPTLQMQTDDKKFDEAVELAFYDWSRAVGLAAKLRTMRMAKIEDGETFAILIDNPALPTHHTFPTPVQLDLFLVEADQVADPVFNSFMPNAADGILFDTSGNPIEYHVLKHHPGDLLFSLSRDYDRLPASSVIHYFRVERPGQVRGIPEIVSSLGIFADLRRYTRATVRAAEVAADFAVMLETDQPAAEEEEGESVAPLPWDTVEMEPGMITVAPDQYKANQMKAEQPSTQYPAAKREFLNEGARPLSCPSNIAAGDSSGYNYASGRLDFQIYRKSIIVEEMDYIERVILDRVFAAWMREAALLPGFLPPTSARRFDHQWFWAGGEHVDPLKEASAERIRLGSGTITISETYAKRGLDYGKALLQQAKEMQERRDTLMGAGFTREEAMSVILQNAPSGGQSSADAPPREEDGGDNGNEDGRRGGRARAGAFPHRRF